MQSSVGDQMADFNAFNSQCSRFSSYQLIDAINSAFCGGGEVTSTVTMTTTNLDNAQVLISVALAVLCNVLCLPSSTPLPTISTLTTKARPVTGVPN